MNLKSSAAVSALTLNGQRHPAQELGRRNGGVMMSDAFDFKGATPETWLCVVCGKNTAPGTPSRVEAENLARALGARWERNQEGIHTTCSPDDEVYTVRSSVWNKAGVDGCLCVGCLEKRLGRRLKPKDFPPDDPLNWMPGTRRLMNRQGRPYLTKQISIVLMYSDLAGAQINAARRRLGEMPGAS
jgi:hypothetical protein